MKSEEQVKDQYETWLEEFKSLSKKLDHENYHHYYMLNGYIQALRWVLDQEGKQ